VLAVLLLMVAGSRPESLVGRDVAERVAVQQPLTGRSGAHVISIVLPTAMFWVTTSGCFSRGKAR
jgi:hypothetical protein